MFTPGPDNDTQTNIGQNTTSKTESGTQSGGSGGIKSPRVRNELIAIPPTTDISSHFRISRTSNHLEDFRKACGRFIPPPPSPVPPHSLPSEISQLLPAAWD